MQQQKSKQIKYYKIRPYELCSIPSVGTGIVLLGVWLITGDLRLGILAQFPGVGEVIRLGY